MNEIAPELTEAVAKRITSPELRDKAVKDLDTFVHRTAEVPAAAPGTMAG